MNKYKYLLKNLGLLTIGNFASKFLAFLLVPLYTSVLSTEEFGIFEIISTTITLLLPILSLDIVEAVLRFPINRGDNDENYVKKVFSIGIRYVGIGCAILSLFLVINHYIGLFQVINDYAVYMLLLYIAQAFNQLLLNFARATNHIKDVSISGVISSVCMLGLNLLFLLCLKMGLSGYFLASIISFLISDLYYIIRIKAYKYFSLFIKDKALTTEMVLYSYPIIFNTVGWWVNNASDRYVVSWISGLSANGIYSVAYKIPSILTVLQAIFNQAWILSSVKEFDPEDSQGFFKNVYNLYNCLITIVCSLLIVFTRVIAKILFANEFYNAWNYSSWLTIAVIFGTLAGVIGGVFSAVKDSKAYAISTCIGALVNVALNIVLVKMFGPVGAAIATLISSTLVWALRLRHVKKYMIIQINYKRDLAAYIILIIQGLILYLDSTVIIYLINILLTILITVLFKEEILMVVSKIKKRG